MCLLHPDIHFSLSKHDEIALLRTTLSRHKVSRSGYCRENIAEHFYRQSHNLFVINFSSKFFILHCIDQNIFVCFLIFIKLFTMRKVKNYYYIVLIFFHQYIVNDDIKCFTKLKSISFKTCQKSML